MAWGVRLRPSPAGRAAQARRSVDGLRTLVGGLASDVEVLERALTRAEQTAATPTRGLSPETRKQIEAQLAAGEHRR